jgi:membrane protein implicated in regulation of membrane protease activity
MTLADFYLLCFLVGLVLTVMFSLSGSAHLHLPHMHLHAGGPPHAHAPLGGAGARGSQVAPINIGTLTAFFAWFGGAGFLMTHYYGVWPWVGLGVATSIGLAGSTIVFWFVASVLVSDDENLDPADYEMVGVLGRIISPIRPGGTGELMFSQQGSRRATAARSEDGEAIPKGTEVIVTRYEKGVAYVRTWESATTAVSAGNRRVEH